MLNDTPAYLAHWGLRRKPFENCCEHQMFVPDELHREALERLLYMVRDGNMGFGLLTGEIGCGKSMVADVLRERLRGFDCHVSNIENCFGDFDSLLRDMLVSLFQPGSYSLRKFMREQIGMARYELVRKFRDIYQQRFARFYKHLIFVLDEAQQLSEESLIELKNLTNFNANIGGKLSIILVGQPELGEMVRGFPQVNQRIGVKYHLLPLSEDGVSGYVSGRMKAAGYVKDAPAFTQSAVTILFEITCGVPREINRVCKLALDRGFSTGADIIDLPVLEPIINDINQQSALSY